MVKANRDFDYHFGLKSNSETSRTKKSDITSIISFSLFHVSLSLATMN